MTDLGRIDRPHSFRFAGGRPLVSYLQFDYIFAAAVFSTAMFTLVLPGAPLVFAVAPVAFALLRPLRLHGLIPCLPLLALPIYGLISVLWSQSPDNTLYYGTQYLITVLLGCMLGALVSERALLHGLFTGFFLFAIVNVAYGLSEGLITFYNFYGHAPFNGLMASKNTQADISALGAMIALSELIVAVRNKRPVLALLALAMIAMTVLIIANAQSTGAIVSILIGTAMILVFTASRMLPTQARFGIFAFVALAAIVALATRHLWYEPLLEYVLKSAGKDSTLTGRTYIWERARVAISQHPLLGVGFAGFWEHGNLEAEAIWRRMQIFNRSGFNFHNSYFEFRVHLGIVGVVLAAVAFLPLAIMLLLRTVKSPTPMAVLYTAIIAYEIGRMNFESVGLGLFHYTTLMVFGALAYATRRGETEAIGPTLRGAPVVKQREWRSA